MDFWEKCLIRTYHCFHENYLFGREHLDWWVEQSVEHGLLQLSKLSDDAVVILRMITDLNHRLRTEVIQELDRRQLSGSDIDLGQYVVSWQRKSLDGWERVASLDRVAGVHSSTLTDLSCASLVAHYLPTCCQFLSRLYLVSPAEMQTSAETAIRKCYSTWDYSGTMPFSACLLGLLRDETPNVLGRWPNPEPDWLKQLDLSEQQFLRKQWMLSKPERILLLSTVYGGFTSPEIAGAVSHQSRIVSPKDVDQMLITIWKSLFRMLKMS